MSCSQNPGNLNNGSSRKKEKVHAHLVEEVGATDCSNLADMVHEAEVPFGGAVQLTHADLSKTSVEFFPYILAKPVSHSHLHFMILLILCLVNTIAHLSRHATHSYSSYSSHISNSIQCGALA